MDFNRFYHISTILYHRFKDSLLTQWLRLLWRLRGVYLGNKVVFVGKSHLYRFDSSSITIGDGVHFVSSAFHNHIGLNRNCSVATETKEAIITIGNNCGFSSTSIVSFKSISIGNNVRVGANTVIMDSDFHLDDERTKPASPIVIEDNVWIGANVVVKKGVHIGANSIIGMNSVVTKDIPANCLAVGVPCKVIK